MLRLFVGVLALALTLSLAQYVDRDETGDSSEEFKMLDAKRLQENGQRSQVTVLDSGIQFEVVNGVGQGETIGLFKSVSMKYSVSLSDKTMIDSGITTYIPDIGEDDMPGLVEALQLLRVGDEAVVYVPGKYNLHSDDRLFIYHVHVMEKNPTQSASKNGGAHFFRVSVGHQATCGMYDDAKKAWVCWGSEDAAKNVPIGKSFSEISIGDTNACGLSEGVISCWGDNSYGESLPPTDVDNFISVAAGPRVSCGLMGSGEIICWGFLSGEVDAPRTYFNDYIQVGVAGPNVCGLRETGQVVCFGGSIGEDPPRDRDFVQLSVGYFHTCARKQNGRVKCWGCKQSNSGQCNVPSDEYSDISAGFEFNCGIRAEDGSARCWGDDSDGQLKVPKSPPRLAKVFAASTFACGLTVEHKLNCWGDAAFKLNPHDELYHKPDLRVFPKTYLGRDEL